MDYSRDAGLTVAVERTFDGQHPCGMCKAIEKTRGSEKKQEALVVVTKLDVFHQPNAELILPVTGFWQQAVVDSAPVVRSHPPSVPPPRNA